MYYIHSINYFSLLSLLVDFPQSTPAATSGPVTLQSLLSVLEGKREAGITGGKDSATGELSFPESGLYGEYLDQESWFDWQSRYDLRYCKHFPVSWISICYNNL